MHLLDITRVKVGPGPLYGIKNYSVTKKINKLDTFKFDIPKANPFSNVVAEEYYFNSDDNQFVIDSITPGDNYITVEGKQDVEEIVNKLWVDGFDCPLSTLSNMAQLAVVGTGWTVAVSNAPTYKRTLKLDSTNTLDILYKIAEKFYCEIVFDSINKVVRFNKKFGESKGVYFSDQLNTSKVYKKIDTKDFATKIIARGKDNMSFASINGGKDYVEDYTYSNKVKVYLWVDNRYTVAESLLEDAKQLLSTMCRPKLVYELDVVDLSAQSGYDFLAYDLGDTVTIMNSEYGYKDVQRVTEITKYPHEPERGTVTLANSSLTFEDINAKNKESNNKVDKAFNEDGTINGNKVDAINGNKITNDSISTSHIKANAINADKIAAGSITADKIDAGAITAEKISAGAITSEKIMAGEVKAANIEAGAIKANSAIIEDLAITTAKIANAAITVAKIQTGFVDTLVASQGQFESAHIKNGAIDTLHVKDAAIKTAQIENLAVTTAKIGDLAITTAKIEDAAITNAKIGSLDAGKITTGSLKADVIKTNVISAINLSTDTATINSAKIGNIDAGKITTGSLSADRIKTNVIAAINLSTETAQIASAKIGNLDASKITSGDISADRIKTNVISAINATVGKISADRIDVSSLVVDEIDAGKITTGDLAADRIKTNVISAINTYTGTAKIKQAQIETLKVGSANITDLDVSKLTGDKIDASLIDVDKIVIKEANISGTINANKISGGAIDANKVSITSTSGNLNISGNTIQIKDNQETPKVRVQIGLDSNGNYGILVLNSAGETIFDSDYGVYEPGIKDLAVSTNKIKDQAVDVNKLNLDSLFVGDSAFINKLSAVEIDATQITTGKIQGDRIDIKGLVSYEALDTTLQPVFDVTGDKTYINGGMIAANTIKANSIDLLSGLTVTGEDNEITFAIAENGQVTVNGLLTSGNYSETNKTGYQLSTDGNAILNQATVRGRVELPNAGITNEYDMEQVSGRNLLLGTGTPMVITAEADAQYKYQAYDYTPEPSTTYTVAFDVKVLAGSIDSITVYGSYSDVVKAVPIENGRCVYTYTTPSEFSKGSDTEWFKKMLIYAGVAGQTGGNSIEVTNLKLEKGDTATEWTPAPEDNLNPVRIWAGSSHELRDYAPFRVMQNGDVYAYNATLTGILYGQVDSGFVNIHDKEITIVDDTVNPEHEYVNIGTTQSRFNNNFTLGSIDTPSLQYINDDRTLSIFDTQLSIVNQGVAISLSNSTSWSNGLTLYSNIDGSSSTLTYGQSSDTWSNTHIITSDGAKGATYGDINIRRKTWTEDVDVQVEGTATLRTSLKGKSNPIEIRNVVNEGWGFYAG